jgi:hypothetical protein
LVRRWERRVSGRGAEEEGTRGFWAEWIGGAGREGKTRGAERGCGSGAGAGAGPGTAGARREERGVRGKVARGARGIAERRAGP